MRPNVARGTARGITGWTTGLLLAGVLPQYLVGSLAVEMQADFRFTDAQLGAAVGISFAIAAAISPLTGRALGAVGIRRGVLVGATIVGLTSLALATLADSGAAVIACMALGGLGSGIGSPSFSALLASEVGAHRHGVAFGLLTSAPQMAAFAAGLALPLIAEPLDWRVAFAAAATLSLVCLLALERRGMPRSVPRSERGERRTRPLPSVYTMATAAALISAAGIGMRSFLVVFAVSIGFGDAGAGLLLAATGLLAIVSRLGFGVLGDWHPGDALRRAAALMLVCAVGFALMALGGNLAVVVGALVAGGLGWGWQSPLTLAVVTHNPLATGPAMGIQMSGFFAGATVGPLLVGLLAHVDGYSSAWIVCSLLALAAGSVALLARRQSPA
ncbi:MAG: MFS transporter [Solirubrobacterales bacterium]|nr:MFS transporter [Solirubrobacterales bacterium]